MSKIELHQIHKSYGDVDIVKGVDVVVNEGEFCVIVGPSGCGKSTLLRMIAGLEDISSGSLKIGGEVMNHVAPDKRGIAMVFQSYALYPHMTIADNIGFALTLQKLSKEEIRQRVKEAAELLQLDHLLNRKPSELSGGQRQRVAIGRAIVKRPKVILFDEPLSNLDAKLRVQMRAELMRLHKEFGSTIIYVTHDQVEAMTMAQKIVVLNAGRVAQSGAPMQLYNNPKSKFVAEFIGIPKMNMLRGSINGSVFTSDNGVEYVAAGDYPKTDTAYLGIRPEHINLTPSDKSIWKVCLIERLGVESFIHLSNDDGEKLCVRNEGDTPLTELQRVDVDIPKSCVYFFRDDDARIKSNGKVTRLDAIQTSLSSSR